MRLTARRIGVGWHPNQVLIAIQTADGSEEFVSVDSNSWDGETLRVSRIVDQRDDNALLIELPREAESGAWRIWIGDDQLKSAEAA